VARINNYTLKEDIFLQYFTIKRFNELGLDGEFNLKYGTIVEEKDGYLYAPDGRCICAITSENGWEHFRPNTDEGAYRQRILDRLYTYYTKNPNSDDFDPSKWPNATNFYWKNLLRTVTIQKLERLYERRLGDPTLLKNPSENV